MNNETLYKMEAGDSKNTDYCKCCYENCAFTFHGSMKEMIETCVPTMVVANPDMIVEKARAMMNKFSSSLKRWKNV